VEFNISRLGDFARTRVGQRRLSGRGAFLPLHHAGTLSVSDTMRQREPRLEDYAMIGDCETAALVSREASIDWLCWPRFDSQALFAGLLGGPQFGHWQIRAADSSCIVRRHYRPETLILQTEFHGARGIATVTDFMPIRDRESTIVRVVDCQRGRMPMHLELVLRFDYGSRIPWVTRLPGNALCAIAGPHRIILQSSVPVFGEDFKTLADFSLRAGQQATFTLRYSPSHQALPRRLDPLKALRQTELYWKRWSARTGACGKYTNAVRRSLITLKALTYRPTGGIVAAPTTSLPERLGGERNWDYRFCWLRDATFTLQAMMNSGYDEEAKDWRDWLLRAVAGDPAQAQILYGIDGERLTSEWELPWLPGYARSRPVRVGNAASEQRQLDMYGEIMDTLYQARCRTHTPNRGDWPLQLKLLEHLETEWRLPDRGIWEVRGTPRHFTYSKVMAWVAFDRAIKTARQFRLKGPIRRWVSLRRQIYAQVCQKAYNVRLGAFVQSYGSRVLDASVLLLPLVGFMPVSDPRMRGTIARIERDLMSDGLVMRYQTRRGIDGLPPGEGAFLACSFWLADNYVLQGHMHKARQLFERLLDLCNDVGLLSEEYDPRARRFLGNFPQAFSHIALINTAHNLTRDSGPATQRSA
jgi:GH15 family glucan-1,4-alpha-glucosidase